MTCKNEDGILFSSPLLSFLLFCCCKKPHYRDKRWARRRKKETKKPRARRLCKRKNKKCSVEFITQKSCRRGFLCRDCGAEHSRFYGIISTRVSSNEIFNVIFPGQPLHARMMKRRKILKTSPRAKAEFERQREKCTYSILSRP